MSTLTSQEIIKFRQDCADLRTVNGIIATTEQNYLKEHLKLEQPFKKPTKTKASVTPPQKKSLITTLIFMCIFTIIAIIMLSNVVLSYVTMSAYTKIQEDPGKEYVDYVNAYDRIESMEELQANWKAVEDAWAKRGVTADWNFVLDAAANHRVNSGETFDSAIMSHLNTKWNDTNTGNGIKVAIFICIILPLTIVFINKFKNALSKYKVENSLYKKNKEENQKNQNYNENVYPTLYKEWEAKKLEVIAEYKAAQAKAQTDKTALELSLSEVYQKFPEKFQTPIHVSNIYDIMVKDKLESVEIGVSHYEAKLKVEHEEKMRKDAEMAALKRINDEFEAEEAAKKQAEYRCKICEYRRDCSMTEKTKYWDTGEVCPYHREIPFREQLNL